MTRLNIKSLQTVLAFIMGFALCNFLNSFHHLTNYNNNEPTNKKSSHFIVEENIPTSPVVPLLNEPKNAMDSEKNGNVITSEISFDSHTDHRQNSIISSLSSPITGSMSERVNFCSILSNINNNSSSLSNPIPSAISLWKQYIPSIFHSSKHGRDEEFIWHDYTSKLLNMISPQRLQNSLKNVPMSNDKWEQIGDIVELAFHR